MQFRRLAWATVIAVCAGAWLVGQAAQVAVAPEAPTLRIIVASSADEAERLAARVRAGEDFAAVARSGSIHPSASAGGLLGRIDVSALRPEVQAVLRGVGPGQVSGVVPVPTGYAFFKVEPAADAGARASAEPAGIPDLMATGAVKYVLDIGGLPEAEAVLREFEKPAKWNESPRVMCQVRRDSLAESRRVFDDFFSPRMEEVRRARPAFELMQAHLGLAQLLSYDGDMDGAIPHYESALQLASAGVPNAVATIQEMLGAAYLHRAEMQNGTYRSPGDLCLIPTPPGRAFARHGDAERAIEQFRAYLEGKPEDLEVRWLLNLAYMLLGEYPDGVPAHQLIPPSSFASTDEVGRFKDVAPAAGLDVFATAGGVIVDDFGTGRVDVVTSNFDTCGPLHYFHNNGDGTFTERAAAAGLGDQLGGLNLVQADYNNDGCRDILVMRGGWEAPQRNSLLRNNCDGTFSDVTAQSGLGEPTSTQTAAWLDVNNDGRLDLFVGNEDRPSQLFLNSGGRFEDISAAAGVGRQTFAKGVAAGDYDNDGFEDLYVSNYDGNNILYHNNRDGTFTDVSRTAGAPGPGRGFATWFFDYDNDGWMDLFATSYFMSVDETARTYLGKPHRAATLKVYRNQGDGTFRDVTADVGLEKVFMPMGANFGDIDNDGFLDIYLGMGTPSYASMAPHVLLRNQGGRRFADVTAASGTGELHKGHGIAFVDLDHDGDEDIVAEIGGATPGDSHAMRVFENPGNGNDWIGVKLVGVKSNRDGLGARITVTVDNQGQGTRSVHRTVGSGGSFGASPLEQHIGLGASARVLDLEVWWPASNTRQHFGGIGVNQTIEIVESSSTYRTIDRKKLRLGGANGAR